jgi:hypothetical protein
VGAAAHFNFIAVVGKSRQFCAAEPIRRSVGRG